LDCLQGPNDDIFNLSEAPVHPFGVVPRKQVVLEFVDQPLPPAHLVVVLAVLLDLDVGQVPLQVLDVLGVVGLVGETGEPASVEPGRQLGVVCAEAVDT
jgi:hypothetical protein